VSSTAERAGASLVQLRRPSVIELRPSLKPRSWLVWLGDAVWLSAVVGLAPFMLWQPSLPPDVLWMMMHVTFGGMTVACAVTIVVVWRGALRRHRQTLAEADGVDR
jgi:hypothetical protein